MKECRMVDPIEVYFPMNWDGFKMWGWVKDRGLGWEAAVKSDLEYYNMAYLDVGHEYKQE